MATRLLVIHRQLVFAVTIKQALEQTGGFAVHPFTKAEAAFEFLRDHPQDIALVDFNLPGRSGSKIIQQLRTLQPVIAIIVTPQLSDGDQRSYGVQGSLNSPFSARDLLPLLQNALDETPSDSLKDVPSNVVGGQMTTSNLGEQKRIKKQQAPKSREPCSSKDKESMPRVERASVFSCTALRSFSNSTITMAMPKSICGIGPRTWPTLPNISATGLVD